MIVLVACSFTYVTAQIYGTGLIASRFLGMQFELAVFAGLVGILVCSMLGGMRAVTWTQVAQYIVLIIAYLTPIIILSTKKYGIADSATHLRTGDRGHHGAGAADAGDRPGDRRGAEAAYPAVHQLHARSTSLPSSCA